MQFLRCRTTATHAFTFLINIKDSTFFLFVSSLFHFHSPWLEIVRVARSLPALWKWTKKTQQTSRPKWKGKDCPAGRKEDELDMIWMKDERTVKCKKTCANLRSLSSPCGRICSSSEVRYSSRAVSRPECANSNAETESCKYDFTIRGFITIKNGRNTTLFWWIFKTFGNFMIKYEKTKTFLSKFLLEF